MAISCTADIIGAGIGGLTTAIALARQGLEVNLYEQSSALGDVGAGITLGPNASRVMLALGLGPQLEALGRTPQHAGVMHYASGQVLSMKQRGGQYLEEFGAPFWHIHRADLVDILDTAAHATGRVHLHTGHRLAGIDVDGMQARIRFDNGREVPSELVVAADGLKSPVRAALFDDTAPRFTGYVAWRGLVPREALPDYEPEPDFALYVGPGKLFGRYTVRGRSLVNYVAMASRDDWRAEGWMVQADLQDVIAEFADWCEPVRAIIAHTPPDRSFQWALHVRDPMDNWMHGPVALLGDAAHPMTPFLGIGAGIAIEDAMVLGRVAGSAATVHEALSRYQSARIAHANQAQRQSAEQGLALLSPPAGGARPEIYGENALGLYNYDATTVAV